jgi:hypothetical protein
LTVHDELVTVHDAESTVRARRAVDPDRPAVRSGYSASG